MSSPGSSPRHAPRSGAAALAAGPALLLAGALLMGAPGAWTAAHLVFLAGTLAMPAAGTALRDLVRDDAPAWARRAALALTVAGALALAGQFVVDFVVMRLAAGDRAVARELFDRIRSSWPLEAALYSVGPALLFTGLAAFGAALLARSGWRGWAGWALVAGTLAVGGGRLAGSRAGEVAGLALILVALARTARPVPGRRLAACLLPLVLAVAGCASGPFAKRLGAVEQATFPAGLARLELRLEVGSVVVEGGAGQAVTSERRVTDDVTTVEEVRGDTLHVDVSCPDGVGGRGCRAEYTLRVPASLAVVVTGEAAGVTLRDLNGELTARTDTGGVEAHNLGGKVDLQVDAGGIKADGLRAPTLTARTSAGSVDLAFAAVPDLVRVRTESGAIDVDLPVAGVTYDVHAVTDAGGVDVDVPTSPGAGHRIELETDAGPIHVRGAAPG
jgi:hypothetical protein